MGVSCSIDTSDPGAEHAGNGSGTVLMPRRYGQIAIGHAPREPVSAEAVEGVVRDSPGNAIYVGRPGFWGISYSRLRLIARSGLTMEAT